MRVSELMSTDVCTVDPQQSLQMAAQCMSELDIGILPVGENDRLVGMISDRDIAVRGIAAGNGPSIPVRDVMSKDVKYCFEDQEIEDVTRNMADQQIRRLPVLNRDKRLVGILSLGDVALAEAGSRKMQHVGNALAGISQPGGEHSQSDGRL